MFIHITVHFTHFILLLRSHNSSQTSSEPNRLHTTFTEKYMSLTYKTCLNDQYTCRSTQETNSSQPSPAFVFFLTVGLALSVPSVAARYMPVTGCGVHGGVCTTWRVLRVSRVRGSCPPGRSLAWWRAGCCAAATTTSCWTTFAGLPRTVEIWCKHTHNQRCSWCSDGLWWPS